MQRRKTQRGAQRTPSAGARRRTAIMRRIWETEKQIIAIILLSRAIAKAAGRLIVANTANVSREKRGRKIRFT